MAVILQWLPIDQEVGSIEKPTLVGGRYINMLVLPHKKVGAK